MQVTAKITIKKFAVHADCVYEVSVDGLDAGFLERGTEVSGHLCWSLDPYALSVLASREIVPPAYFSTLGGFRAWARALGPGAGRRGRPRKSSTPAKQKRVGKATKGFWNRCLLEAAERGRFAQAMSRIWRQGRGVWR